MASPLLSGASPRLALYLSDNESYHTKSGRNSNYLKRLKHWMNILLFQSGLRYWFLPWTLLLVYKGWLAYSWRCLGWYSDSLYWWTAPSACSAHASVLSIPILPHWCGSCREWHFDQCANLDGGSLLWLSRNGVGRKYRRIRASAAAGG